MSRARRQQYMLRTEASEQEEVITICIMPIENNQVLKRWEEKKWQK